MRQAGAQVTRRVDGVAGRAAQGGADGHHQQGRSQRAQARGGGTEHDDHEHQHEGGDDFRDEVPAVVADLRAGGEHAEDLARVLLHVEVVLVGQPHQDGADEGADQLGQQVGQHVGDGAGDGRQARLGVAREHVRAVGQQAQGHGRVQVCTGLVRDVDTGEHAESPAHVDHEPAAAVALGPGQDVVGDDAATEKQQHRGAGDLVQEDRSDRFHRFSSSSPVPRRCGTGSTQSRCSCGDCHGAQAGRPERGPTGSAGLSAPAGWRGPGPGGEAERGGAAGPRTGQFRARNGPSSGAVQPPVGAPDVRGGRAPPGPGRRPGPPRRRCGTPRPRGGPR